jgi:STE24 endopeptidase
VNEDKSTRYRRLERRASLYSAALAAIALLLFLISGGSAAFRDALGGSSWLTLLPFTIVLAVAVEVLQAPFAYYKGVTLERRYGLSAQSAAGWIVDHVRVAQVGLVFALIAASVIWASMRLVPDAWWLAAAGAAVVMLALVARVAPVLLLPLFYDFTPLDRPALVARLHGLAGRAGMPVLGVYTWRMADKTRKANAALAGLGATRRILISDTLLAEHSDDEIEVVLAHELAHHVHRDLWSSLAMEGLLLAASLYAADRVLDRAAGAFGLMGKTDIAALPLLVLSAAAVMLLLRPLANALSRLQEHRADRYALNATGNTAAFISAMKRLGEQNLAEEQPPRLVQLLFCTHPPMAARIAAARTRERSERPERS